MEYPASLFNAVFFYNSCLFGRHLFEPNICKDCSVFSSAEILFILHIKCLDHFCQHIVPDMQPNETSSTITLTVPVTLLSLHDITSSIAFIHQSWKLMVQFFQVINKLNMLISTANSITNSLNNAFCAETMPLNSFSKCRNADVCAKTVMNPDQVQVYIIESSPVPVEIWASGRHLKMRLQENTVHWTWRAFKKRKALKYCGVFFNLTRED